MKDLFRRLRYLLSYRRFDRELANDMEFHPEMAANSTRVAVEGEERQLNASFVTANYFRELGATPILGRLLDPSRDEASGAEPAIVLGYGYWQRHFGADPLVVGKTIHLNGKP